MRNVLALAAAYAFFAAIATAFNLGTQWLVFEICDLTLGPRSSVSIFIALACGTALGLALKYVLDKRYIFRDLSTGSAMHAKKFSLYSAMGLITTAIFWGSELLANAIDPGGRLVYIGGALGLAVGYFLKYQLDRRFVFRAAA